MADRELAARLATAQVFLANPPPPAPPPKNNNPKVFQCVSDYISKNKQTDDTVSKNKQTDDTVSQINKLVNDGELIDGYGAPLGGYKITPLMYAVRFKDIDIKVVKALLDNGADVNIEDLFGSDKPLSDLSYTTGQKTSLMYAADNSAYMGQEIVKSILFNRPDVDIKLLDYYGKSILSYILSNYEKYVESVKKYVYKLIKEDEDNVNEHFDRLLIGVGNEDITLELVEKCLLDTNNNVNCEYMTFLDNHINKLRKEEINFINRRNNIKTEQTNRGETREKQNQMDVFVTTEATKLVTEFIDKILDHKDIVYIINRPWKSGQTILTCLELILGFYKDKSTMTLNLIQKCIKKGANVNRVLHKIFEFDNPLEILEILDTNDGVDVTARLIFPRSARPNEIGGFPVPYDNFLTYTIIWRESIEKNIPVLKFIVDKLDKLDDDKVVNCILSPNYYNTTSITAAMDIIKDKKIEKLEGFINKYMEYDDKILNHAFIYAVKSDNLKVFNIANSIITITEGIEGGIKVINDLLEGMKLEGMKIPDRIQKAIDAALGGPDAKAAGINYRSAAQEQAAAKKQKTAKYGSSRRSYVKAPLAKTKKKPRRRSHKKKALA